MNIENKRHSRMYDVLNDLISKQIYFDDSYILIKLNLIFSFDKTLINFNDYEY